MEPTPKELARLRDEENLTYVEIGMRFGRTGDWAAGQIKRYKNRTKAKEARAEQPDAPLLEGQREPPDGDKLEITARANSQEIDYLGRGPQPRIQTLAQLLEACSVDLSVWAVERHVVNKWEVGSKDPDGAVTVTPLFQVKAWLVRRVPEKVKPVVAPVMVEVRPRATIRARDRAMHAALVLCDPHFGFRRDMLNGTLTAFHDRLALDACLQIAQVVAPDDIFFLGDVMDFASWQDKFIREPGFYATTQPALIEAAYMIRQFKEIARSRTSYIEGNHDVRPERAVMLHLVDAYELRAADQLELPAVMSIDHLLGLQRMGVDYLTGYPDGEIWINQHARLIHGDKVRSQPGQTASAVVRDAHETTVFGHIHRREMATKTIVERDRTRLIQAYCPGCLCHVDGRVPGSTRRAQWQQGAAVIWYDDESCSITPIDIENGRAFFNGHVFEGKDYTRELVKQTGWTY